MTSPFVDPGDIRARFCAALSNMYRAEVPLYAELLDIVETVNAQVGDASGVDVLPARLALERHGAIRLGTAEELATMARAFAVMGMEPVGYYDLAPAGVPVHSTAFRPVSAAALAHCPFRVFCSLLRLELIEDPDLREEAAVILARRQIFSADALALIARAEAQGGLDTVDAQAIVDALLETFRWHENATVDSETYDRLAAAHRLVADIVAFKGPHINHLTPRVLDIDAVQAEMLARGIDAKDIVEGPPQRKVPILLRQTSFKARTEAVRFTDQAQGETGLHTARFGEIEQRGIALTPKGRALYDELLAKALADTDVTRTYQERLTRAFAGFPDDADTLRDEGLAYFRRLSGTEGQVWYEPVTYEDFLPVSAAGIFQSNLAGEAQRNYAGAGSQAVFETALGRRVLDPFALYAASVAAPTA